MQPAAEEMAERARIEVSFAEPAYAIVVQNIDAGSAYDDPEEIRGKSGCQQMCGAVLWTETVLAFEGDGCRATLVECGPGKVLTGLARRIDQVAINGPQHESCQFHP